jgi:hypothetical protein
MTTDMPPTVQTELTRLLDTWSGALLSRSRVTDDLLDLRGLVADHPQAQARVDRALANLPGQNVVAREWAVEVVADVAECFGCVTAS